MWVFDGEMWIEESAERAQKPESPRPQHDEFTPELQVIEIEYVRPSVPMPRLPFVPIP